MFLLAMLTFGLSGLVFMFIYNGLYTKDLISSGFKAVPDKTGSTDDVYESKGIRKCPYCAETIKLEAKVCKHCSRELPEEEIADELEPKEPINISLPLSPFNLLHRFNPLHEIAASL